MSRIAVVTDTNSSMTREETDALGVYLLPMPIIINGEEFFEGVNCPYERFFELLDAGAEVSTSQPSPEAVTSLWDEALKDNDYVIHIPMSSALSGSCQTAAALAADYNGRVFVIDNKRISISQRSSVFDALEMIKQGLSAAEIAEKLTEQSADNSIYLAVHTLELLKKSGRVTAAGAAFAAILSINPVLQIQGGKLDAFAKVRGMKNADKAMLKAIDDDLKNRFDGRKLRIDLAYSGNVPEEWIKTAKEHFSSYDIEVCRLPLSICCHVAGGVHAIGISLIGA